MTKSITAPIDASLAAAEYLLRKYYSRGLEDIKNMGEAHPKGLDVQIGGYMDGKYYNNDWIMVHRDMNGKQVNKVYSKKQIYDGIKEEMECTTTAE